MPDLREAILARLVAIAAEVPGVAIAGRNRVGLSETARPAVIVLDADEALGGRPPLAPESFIPVDHRPTMH